MNWSNPWTDSRYSITHRVCTNQIHGTSSAITSQADRYASRRDLVIASMLPPGAVRARSIALSKSSFANAGQFNEISPAGRIEEECQ